jgi:hypothetical protein
VIRKRGEREKREKREVLGEFEISKQS